MGPEFGKFRRVTVVRPLSKCGAPGGLPDIVLAKSGCALRALPEGLIDPWLKTVAFYDREDKIAACHYYATHPMSYYGDGRVSSDFVGLARKRRQNDESTCTHISFNGCAGNVTAGKYNDGSKAQRPVLAGRVYDGIVRSESQLRPEPIDRLPGKRRRSCRPRGRRLRPSPWGSESATRTTRCRTGAGPRSCYPGYGGLKRGSRLC